MAYATVEELIRILKLRNVSVEQTVALERVLEMAAGEIDSEIDLAADSEPLAGWQLSLAAEVNLERAAELWYEEEIRLGLVGIGTEIGPTRVTSNTWEKFAQKLAPLKAQWGVA